MTNLETEYLFRNQEQKLEIERLRSDLLSCRGTVNSARCCMTPEQNIALPLSAKGRRLYAQLLLLESRGGLLESQIVGSGLNAALNELLRCGWARIEPHATVKDRGVYPAATVFPVSLP
jgi:hypothetical protein